MFRYAASLGGHLRRDLWCAGARRLVAAGPILALVAAMLASGASAPEAPTTAELRRASGAAIGDAGLTALGASPAETPAAAIRPDGVRSAVVSVETGTAADSGFVAGDGVILTAAHVVGSASTVRIRFANGAQRIGRVVARDHRIDVAAIDVDRGPCTSSP